MKKTYNIKAELVFTGNKYFQVQADSEEEARDIAEELAYDFDEFDLDDDMTLESATLAAVELEDCDGPYTEDFDAAFAKGVQ